MESSDGIIQGVVHLIRRGGKVASEKRAGDRYFDVAAALSEEGICIFFTLTCCDAWHPLESSDGIIQGVSSLHVHVYTIVTMARKTLYFILVYEYQ